MSYCLLVESFSSYWSRIEPAMMDACANSAIGIVVVFAALLFFTFVISLFKYINMFEQKKRKDNEKK